MNAKKFQWTANEYIEHGSGNICLCGSTRFFFEAMEANRLLTFNNWLVTMCGSWEHSFHKYVENDNLDYAKVKKLHFEKILASDAIVVVTNSTFYIDDSTKAEIKFAEYLELPVFHFDGVSFMGKANSAYPNRYDTTPSVIQKFAFINGGLGF